MQPGSYCVALRLELLAAGGAHWPPGMGLTVTLPIGVASRDRDSFRGYHKVSLLGQHRLQRARSGRQP
jgi:hypothetical protein